MTEPDPRTPLLSLRGVGKIWRPGAVARWMGNTRDTVALDGVDLDVFPGEVVGLIGESGCGKTTLARVALGLLGRDRGEVRVLGVDPALQRGEAELRLRRQAQLLLQDAGASLNPGLRVGEILAESARVHQPGAPVAPIVDSALAAVGLSGRASARPSALSGGERRRVTLAMLSIAAPRLVVADEPTAGLDASRKAALLDLLLGARAADGSLLPVVSGAAAPEGSTGSRLGRGVLLVSHDLPLVLYACTRVVVMREGRVVDGFSKIDAQNVQSGDRHPWTLELLQAAGIPAVGSAR